MDDRSQPPPLPDAPNAGDPTPRTLRLGDLIIEGVERVSEEEELSDHAVVFYNELITLMNAAGPSWQLIRKERYDKIKDVLIRIRNGESVSHVRRDHLMLSSITGIVILPITIPVMLSGQLLPLPVL
jgi:hypothetical protein